MIELFTWWHTRFLCLKIAALCGVLSVAVMMAGMQDPPIVSIALLVSIVMQLRLWDDLVDAEYDRLHFPQRVIARTTHSHRFWCALLIVTMAIVLLIFSFLDWIVLLLYFALNVWMFVVYRSASGDRRVRNHLVLTKYPLLVLMLTAAPWSMRSIAAALLVYLLIAFYERIDKGVVSI